MGRAEESAYTAVCSLDERILSAVTGQERELLSLMAHRDRAVQDCLRENPTAAILEDLQSRTSRLEAHFLHWRRSAIMELSKIDSHLRFLNEQESGSNRPTTPGLNYSA